MTKGLLRPERASVPLSRYIRDIESSLTVDMHNLDAYLYLCDLEQVLYAALISQLENATQDAVYNSIYEYSINARAVPIKILRYTKNSLRMHLQNEYHKIDNMRVPRYIENGILELMHYSACIDELQHISDMVTEVLN